MNKIIKVITSVMMLSSIFLYNIGDASASENPNSHLEGQLVNDSISGNDYSIEVVKETSKYQEYKFVHKETGEIEHLVIEDTKDGIVYTATSSKGEKSVVTRESDLVTIENEDKEIQYINVAEEPTEYLSNEDYQTFYVPNPGQGKWHHLSGSDYYGQRAIDVATYALGISIIISIATGNIPGAAIIGSAGAIMSYFISLKIKNFWYIKQTYWDKKPNSFNRAYFTRYYAYPDYTNYTGSLWAE